jgi:hypothetical protein
MEKSDRLLLVGSSADSARSFLGAGYKQNLKTRIGRQAIKHPTTSFGHDLLGLTGEANSSTWRRVLLFTELASPVDRECPEKCVLESTQTVLVSTCTALVNFFNGIPWLLKRTLGYVLGMQAKFYCCKGKFFARTGRAHCRGITFGC